MTAYSDNEVDPGTTYEYKVRAVNSLGNSEWSNRVKVTTLASTP